MDTDLALGAPSGDVDDGFALAALLVDPAVELLGISVVDGNTDAATAAECVRRLLEQAGRRDLEPCSPGVAPQRLAALPDGAALLALGPLTNIARAVALDSTLPRRVSLATVASVRRRWRHPWLAFYCLNTRADRPAACALDALVWRQRRVYPLDVVRRLRFDRADLDRLESLGGLGAYLARGSRRWLRQAWWRYRAASFPAWDLVAALDHAGRLPSARFDGRHRLEGFDLAAAKPAFFSLLQGAGEYLRSQRPLEPS